MSNHLLATLVGSLSLMTKPRGLGQATADQQRGQRKYFQSLTATGSTAHGGRYTSLTLNCPEVSGRQGEHLDESKHPEVWLRPQPAL